MPIRNANIEDQSQISILLSQLGGYDETEKFLPKRLDKFLSNPDHYVLVYENEIESSLEGLIAFAIIPELGRETDTALITYIVVKEESRSKKIGKQLEEACISIAQKRNCTRLQLHCSEHREKAHQFYHRLGYSESPKYFSKTI